LPQELMPMNLSKKGGRDFVLCAGLVVAVFLVYWPVRQQEFINYDDPDYVTSNTHVQKGITWDGVVWAFTTTRAYNWHPLTWLSHMLDCQLFGLDAGAHKLVSVMFHIGSTALLFLVLKRMTAAPGRSLFVAAVFALHPLRVESVAWVAERKDVLCTFFSMLTLGAYVRYVERRTAGRYALVVLLFALALMAKPTAVVLPLVLLLLDAWPLNRLALDRPKVIVPAALRLVLEKWLLFVLSAFSCAVSYWVQSRSESGSAIKLFALSSRASNAVVAYARYIGKTLWPADLAVFYPHPGRWEISEVGLATLAVVGVTLLVVRQLRGRPFLAVGWLWYLGTLVPMIGLVQAGDQSIADRYTYVPMIGLLVMVAWGIPELISGRLRAAPALNALPVLLVITLMCATHYQLQFWQNSIRLYEHALTVTKDNYIAHNNLGIALLGKGEIAVAAGHFQSALDIWPPFPEANKNLADILARSGRLDEAASRYQRAIQGKPGWAEAHNNLGLVLARQGKLDEAVTEFSRVLELEPNAPVAESNLGLALMKLGRFDEAWAHASRALDLDPKDAQARRVVGVALEKKGQQPKATQ
jgi:protein O-mannosyl-transferase